MTVIAGMILQARLIIRTLIQMGVAIDSIRTPREIQMAINQGQEERIGHLMDHIAFAQDRSQWEQVPPIGMMASTSGSIASGYQEPIPPAAAAAGRR